MHKIAITLMNILKKNRCKELHFVGVIYLDLNGLKEINDKMGHLAGDTLIISASYVLQEIFADNSYRIGGDEFVVIEQDVLESEFMGNPQLDRVD